MNDILPKIDTKLEYQARRLGIDKDDMLVLYGIAHDYGTDNHKAMRILATCGHAIVDTHLIGFNKKSPLKTILDKYELGYYSKMKSEIFYYYTPYKRARKLFLLLLAHDMHNKSELHDV